MNIISADRRVWYLAITEQIPSSQFNFTKTISMVLLAYKKKNIAFSKPNRTVPLAPM